MIRQNKKGKKKSTALIFLVLITISSLLQFSYFKTNVVSNNETNPLLINDDENMESSPLSADLNLSNYITGMGINHTTRVYMTNTSSSNGNMNYFNISAPADNTYLSYADLNFTFQNNYTTNHIIEGDSASTIDINNLILFNYNSDESYSNLSINPGTNLTEYSLSNLTDASVLTSFELNSSGNGVLNFTIDGSFTGARFDRDKGTTGLDAVFDWTEILGIFLTLTYNVSRDVNFTILMKDYEDKEAPVWKNVTNTIFINSSLGPYHYVDEIIENQNLDRISTLNASNIQFKFNRTDNNEFNITVYDFDLKSFQGFYVPITNESHVALEFDLRGLNSTVNGFYAWIRTVNIPDYYYENYQFNTDTSSSNISITPGTNLTIGGLDNLTDGKGYSFYVLNTSGNGLLNFTIRANFSDVSSGKYLNFNRSLIRSLILDFTYNISKNANFTIYIRDTSLIWHNITETTEINSGSGTQVIDDLEFSSGDYIDAFNCSYIQFVFNRTNTTESFNTTLFTFDFNATARYDFPSIDSELNITLYRANGTITRLTEADLRTNTIIPDSNQQIDSILLDNEAYHGDTLTYFGFNISKTSNLNLSNYFIVIKSNISKPIYELVTVPEEDYGDGIVEHSLKVSLDQATTWVNAEDMVGGYTENSLDASGFKLNVTRGYMPSDFNNTLTFQNITLKDLSMDKYPYNESSSLTWGLGRWEPLSLPIPIVNNSNGIFQVNLTWDKNITMGFTFNVNYTVTAYRVENATSTYEVIYDGIPEWTLNYTLGLKKSMFDNWNFTTIMMIFPNYYAAYNLTTPKGVQILNDVGGASLLSENLNYKKVVISTDIINVSDTDIYNGSYLLNVTSLNYMKQVHSYINFNGTLWETRGFMYGDNISVSLDVQDHDLKSPLGGYGNVSLFYPNGTNYPTDNLVSFEGENSSDNLIRSYSFGNSTILNITINNIPISGKYYLGYFWSNGSAIGCKKMEIFIDSYKIELNDLTYYPNQNVNILDGNLDKVLNNYSIMVASVNETTGINRPDFYPINTSISAYDGTYSREYLGETLEIYMKSFMQNETILNPNETVNCKVLIENQHSFLDVNVKVKVKLISFVNPDWIIAETTSATQVLKLNGDLNDEHEFDMDIKIPELHANEVWMGVNCPVRKSGVRTQVSLYIEDDYVDTYNSTDISMLVNVTDDVFEGHIITIKSKLETTSGSVLEGFERDECLYLPNQTAFVVNIYDQYYMSSYNQIVKSFSLKSKSEFINITIAPSIPLNGNPFNVSSLLIAESGGVLQGKEAYIQYNGTGTWVNISTSQLTNVNGSTNFLIDTSTLANIQSNIYLKLAWKGDTQVLNDSLVFTVVIELQENNITVAFIKLDDLIYRDMNTTLHFQISNTGNSNLKITNISVATDSSVQYSITGINYLLLEYFTPGDKIDLYVEVKLENFQFETLNITIAITGQNLVSNELTTVSINISLTVLDHPLEDYLMQYFFIIILVIIGTLWLLAFIYVKKTTKKIESPELKTDKSGSRRGGRYVKVSELKTEKTKQKKPTTEDLRTPYPGKIKKRKVQKGPIKKEATKGTTDFDSILEETGLKDKDKKKK